MDDIGIGSIIGIIILFGFIILVLTGLGILTTAIFGISTGKKSGPNQAIIDYLKKANPNATLPADIPMLENSVETGDYTIKLAGANLMVSKIALITFWILIAIGFIGLLAIFISD